MDVHKPLLQTLDLPFALSIFFLISVFTLFRLINGARSEKLNTPPSPPKLPIIGNLHQLGKLIHRSLHDISEKYGSLVLLHMGRNPMLVVSSAEMAKEIKTNHDIVFANRPFMTASNLFFYGCINVAFSPYSEYWRQVRKVCVMELLSLKRVQSFHLVREEEVALMIENISSSRSTGVPVNVSEILLAVTNNIVSRCVLGRKYEENGDNRFGELSKELVRLLAAFSFGDMFPWLAWMDFFFIRKIKKISKELDIFFDQIIDEHLMQIKEEDCNAAQDFVDILLHIQQNDSLGISFGRTNIKAIILDMFVGGTGTASTAMEWVMAELVKNPNVMMKVQEEVRRVVGKKKVVNMKDIRQMVYLESVIKETLRLHPPFALLVQENSTNTTVKGYHIPAKSTVLINLWAIQRDFKSWDSPCDFIPERFINNPIDFNGQDYEFIPFGSGRRRCPGMAFAMAIVEVVVVNLIYWFDWELPDAAEKEQLDMSEDIGLSVSRKIPLHLVPVSNFS